MQAGITGAASAERSEDIKLGLERLPDFLRELRPLMADLDKVAVQGTPLLRDFGSRRSPDGPADPQPRDLLHGRRTRASRVSGTRSSAAGPP